MTTITRTQYLQLLGLMTLAKMHNDKLRDIEISACAITGVVPGEYSGNCGHTSDMVYGSRELDDGLRCMKITVVDDQTVPSNPGSKP
jgi:hypothetical protein